MIAYVYDKALHHEVNARRENYWDIYIREIMDLMGVRGAPRSLQQLEEVEQLAGVKVLILGRQSGRRMTQKAKSALDAWVQGGGILIGFAPKGLDHIFGIESRFTCPQGPDEYSITGLFELYPHPITNGIHPFLYMEQKLLIISEIEAVCLHDGIELARLHDLAGRDRKEPAITWRQHGKGLAGYFAFDLAKTMWVLRQGRPIKGVPEDGEGYCKTIQLQVLGDYLRKVLYADELMYVLQNMIAQSGHPFIYQLPPSGEAIPAAVLYWGGDEYFGPTKLSLDSSDWMKSKGLPYHVNIGVERHPGMNDGHPMTPEEFKHIRDNGHEVSLYYMLYDDNNFAITEERIKHQNELFYRRFGYRPVCTLHYNCSWKGWADPARWMAAAGGKADMSFGNHGPQPYNHPMRNTPYFGFGQGTGYPFYFWDDAEHGNERIALIEEPMICYETGHRGLGTAPKFGKGGRPGDLETRVPGEIHAAIDTALTYHLLLNMFYHQNSVASRPAARDAIEEALRYIEYRKAPVLHLANDQVADWWFARSAAEVRPAAAGDSPGAAWTCRCDYPAGMIMKRLLPDAAPRKVACDGRELPAVLKKEFGGDWQYFIVPRGEHRITIA